MQVIHVPEQSVVMPGRKAHTVSAFTIASRPITSAEFALFAKRTGYLADAEQARHEFTVYDNPSLNGIPLAGWVSVPALFVSRTDATAFCRYQRVSLPSPSQWLAFLRYVEAKGLFALAKQVKGRSKGELKTQFSGGEWLEDPKRLWLGRPPVLKLPGLLQPYSEDSDKLVQHEDSAGDISITFRVVVEG